ncbi:MAG: energy transducer TonB [Sphingomonadaceae bacterium]|nr:energy transducer TonB [Sphingomonadaceae bacterium]
MLLLASPAPAQSLQLDFNAAQALLDKGDAQGSLTAFEAVAQSYSSDASADRMLLASVYQRIGRIHEMRAELREARIALERSLALASQSGRNPQTLLALARVTMFDDPKHAETLVDAVLPILRSQRDDGPPDRRRDALADVYALKGRIYLNRGRFETALDWFQKALEAAGGLTKSVTIADTRIRGDMALVAHLLNREQFVARYLASSGAGQGNVNIEVGASTPLPQCGSATGIAPDDMAIVEFAIAANGGATNVAPVYATRPETADDFARAVAAWSWSPDAAAKLDSFWRQSVRVELRCLNGPELPPPVQGPRNPAAVDVSATPLPPRCAIAGPRPAATSPTAPRFPSKAANWGFAGWSRLSYDILTTGVPANPRVVMAYPPLIFNDASLQNIRSLRFQPLPGAGGGIGCIDRLQLLRYAARRTSSD